MRSVPVSSGGSALEDPSFDRVPVLAAPEKWEFRKVPRPEPLAGQIRVAMEGCGVCASGLPTWQGREWFSYPLTPGQLGHEGWGVIDAVGQGVDPALSGQRVATWADGAYAPFLCVNPGEVLPLPEALAGRPVPIEPLGCAINVMRRARVEAGMPVVIIGVGFLGAVLIQLLVAAGAEVHAVARRPFARKLARDLGATTVAPWAPPAGVAAFFGAAGRAAFPRVIECAGASSALSLASTLVDIGGRLMIAGYHQDGPRSIDMQEWNWKGIDVINAHEREPAVIREGMRLAIGALVRGDIDLAPLLTHHYAPDHIGRAYADLEARPDGFLKGWIDFNLNSMNP